MSQALSVEFRTNRCEKSFFPLFKFVGDGISQAVAKVQTPVQLDVWDKARGKEYVLTADYTQIRKVGDTYVCDGELITKEGVVCTFADVWSLADNNSWQMDRIVYVKQGAPDVGIRLAFDVVTDFEGGIDFKDLQFFSSPAVYDKNDLDGDGTDDYLNTKKVMYRDDRLNTLGFMVYHPGEKLALILNRTSIPAYDENPDRPNKEDVFFQKTDIGSMGYWSIEGDSQIMLRAKHPFYEGERSIARLVKERIGWGAYWPAATGECIKVSYQFRVWEQPSFIDALWKMYATRMHELDSRRVDLPAPAEVLARYRVHSLDKYYVEKNSEEDRNEPAGYVLNCHPTDGIQLSDIIQYGFTGQNTVSAYCSMRQGYAEGNKQLVEHGQRTLNFFADRVHLPESGIFYNQYNVERGEFGFWWTGILLPLAYAEGERLKELMGPLYDYLEHVIVKLREVKGSYLRCINEEAYGLIIAYDFAKKMGVDNPNWLKTALCYGRFLVEHQAEDGTWYRAYDTDGNPITDPEIWFGKTYYEQKGCTCTSVPFLLELYKQTGEEIFMQAAEKAGKYVADISIEKIKFCGGIHDSIFNKGVLVDNESTLYCMIAMNELYKATGKDYYQNAARRGASIYASWTWLWDIPLPTGSTLQKYGFRSTGIGGCDTPSVGYTHPFENRGVAALAEIAIATGDADLMRVAELTWHGCNQTVAIPKKDWGLSEYGFQEEGYFTSWLYIDDPMFEDDTGFGHRWKGEGNKTNFPWISAVALISYWQMIDRFNTANFDEIKKNLG